MGKNLWNLPLIRIILVALLAGAVFQGAVILKTAAGSLLPDWLTSNENSMTAIFKTCLALLSLLIILALPGRNLSQFGFCLPRRLNYFKLVIVSLAVSLGSLFLFAPLYMGFLSHLFGVKMSGGFDFGSSILIMIIGVWFWSSTTEEIYNRGLLQTLLQGLENRRWLGLSLPVWVSALLFGLAHFSVFKITDSPFFVMMIVSNATLMGLLAAWYREKSGSILPAILVHILANIGGSLPALLLGNL